MELEYQITPMKLVRGLTAFVILLFIGMAIGIPTMIYLDEGIGQALFYTTVLLVAVFLPLLLLTWAYSPQHYIVSEKGITITRPVKPVFIPINTITQIEEREYNIFKLVKKGGNNGLFSITGKFWTKTDGDLWF